MSGPSTGGTRTLRLVTGTGGRLDPALSGETVGIALGFYESEGVHLQISTADGSAGSTAALLAGDADIAHTNAPWYLQAAADRAAIDAVTVYNWTREVQWCVAVPRGSAVETIDDLAGSAVGTSGPSESASPGFRSIFAARQLDVRWEFVGVGSPAVQALADGQVAALVTKDYYAADATMLADLRLLPAPAEMTDLMGTGVSARGAVLRESPDAVLGFLRGLVQSTVFAIENPGAALELHWQLFPRTRPDPCTDEVIAQTARVVAARAAKWRRDPMLLPRWGQHRRESWEAYRRLLRLTPEQVGDVSRFYTDELLDEVNTVDTTRAAALARDQTLQRSLPA